MFNVWYGAEDAPLMKRMNWYSAHSSVEKAEKEARKLIIAFEFAGVRKFVVLVEDEIRFETKRMWMVDDFVEVPVDPIDRFDVYERLLSGKPASS